MRALLLLFLILLAPACDEGKAPADSGADLQDGDGDGDGYDVQTWYYGGTTIVDAGGGDQALQAE